MDCIKAAPEQAASDELPHDYLNWNVPKLKRWLKERTQQTLTVNKPDLQGMVRIVCEQGLKNASVAGLEREGEERYRRDKAAWADTKAAREHGRAIDLQGASDLSFVPTLNNQAIVDVFEDHGANSTRNEVVGESRFVSQVFVHAREKFKTKEGLELRRVCAVGVAGRSLAGKTYSTLGKASMKDAAGHDGRVVLIRMIVFGAGRDGHGGEVVGRPEIFCVLPEDMLCDKAKACIAKKGRRVCRPGGMCVHGRSVAAALRSVGPCGVDGSNTWTKARASSRAHEKDSFAHLLPIMTERGIGKKRKVGDADVSDEDGDPGIDCNEPIAKRTRRTYRDRVAFQPLPAGKLAEIDKGPDSAVYGPKLRAVLEAKKEALQKSAVGDRAHLAGRGFKFETILDRAKGCPCEWCPGTGTSLFWIMPTTLNAKLSWCCNCGSAEGPSSAGSRPTCLDIPVAAAAPADRKPSTYAASTALAAVSSPAARRLEPRVVGCPAPQRRASPRFSSSSLRDCSVRCALACSLAFSLAMLLRPRGTALLMAT